MKPITGLAISILACASTYCQQFTGTRRGGFSDGVTPVSAAVFNPTNGFGLAAAYWYEPSAYNSYGTNASIPVLQNLTSLGHAYDQTNRSGTAGNFPVGDARGNASISTLDYVGSQWLENTAFTNTSSGEYWMVLAVTQNVGGFQFMFDSDNSGARQAYFDPDNGSFEVFSGVSDFVSDDIFSRFFVVDVVIDNANSLYYCFTNGVGGRLAAGNTTQPAQGFRTGMHNAGIDGCFQAVATEFVFTNTVLASSGVFFGNQVRSNAYNYCTNLIARLGLPFP